MDFADQDDTGYSEAWRGAARGGLSVLDLRGRSKQVERLTNHACARKSTIPSQQHQKFDTQQKLFLAMTDLKTTSYQTHTAMEHSKHHRWESLESTRERSLGQHRPPGASCSCFVAQRAHHAVFLSKTLDGTGFKFSSAQHFWWLMITWVCTSTCNWNFTCLKLTLLRFFWEVPCLHSVKALLLFFIAWWQVINAVTAGLATTTELDEASFWHCHYSLPDCVFKTKSLIQPSLALSAMKISNLCLWWTSC